MDISPLRKPAGDQVDIKDLILKVLDEIQSIGPVVLEDYSDINSFGWDTVILKNSAIWKIPVYGFSGLALYSY